MTRNKETGKMPQLEYKPKTVFDKKYLPHSNRFITLNSVGNKTLINNLPIDSDGKPIIEVAKGNKKYPKELGIWIFNMGPASACPSDKRGLCYCSDICYAKKAEKQYYQNTPAYRWRQNLEWNTLIPEQFVYSIRKQNEDSKKHKLKMLRFNEASDFESINDLKKLVKIANLMPDITVFTYTARRDWNWEQIIPLLPSNLIINGSNHLVSNNYIPVTEDIYNNIIENNNIVKCHCIDEDSSCGDCRYCMEQNKQNIYCLIH